MHPPALAARDAALASLADEHRDLLIVGDGIVGCGALLDATSRGLKAALGEQDDLALGTYSRSSRLIHGGLRYLEDLTRSSCTAIAPMELTCSTLTRPPTSKVSPSMCEEYFRRVEQTYEAEGAIAVPEAWDAA